MILDLNKIYLTIFLKTSTKFEKFYLWQKLIFINLKMKINLNWTTLFEKDFQLNYILKTWNFVKSSSYDWCNSYFNNIVTCFNWVEKLFISLFSHSCPSISLRKKLSEKLKKYIVRIWKKWEILYYLKEKFIKLNVCCFFFYSSKSK